MFKRAPGRSPNKTWMFHPGGGSKRFRGDAPSNLPARRQQLFMKPLVCSSMLCRASACLLKECEFALRRTTEDSLFGDMSRVPYGVITCLSVRITEGESTQPTVDAFAARRPARNRRPRGSRSSRYHRPSTTDATELFQCDARSGTHGSCSRNGGVMRFGVHEHHRRKA